MSDICRLYIWFLSLFCCDLSALCSFSKISLSYFILYISSFKLSTSVLYLSIVRYWLLILSSPALSLYFNGSWFLVDSFSCYFLYFFSLSIYSFKFLIYRSFSSAYFFSLSVVVYRFFIDPFKASFEPIYLLLYCNSLYRSWLEFWSCLSCLSFSFNLSIFFWFSLSRSWRRVLIWWWVPSDISLFFLSLYNSLIKSLIFVCNWSAFSLILT